MKAVREYELRDWKQRFLATSTQDECVTYQEEIFGATEQHRALVERCTRDAHHETALVDGGCTSSRSFERDYYVFSSRDGEAETASSIDFMPSDPMT